MDAILHIQPNGPLLFRDTRPFNTGDAARTQLFPHPSVTTGTIRTLLGKQLGYSFTDVEVARVLDWSIYGPVLRLGDHNYFPAPADAILPATAIKRLSPFELKDGEGMNLPDGLLPIGSNQTGGKPMSDPPLFWRDKELYKWLACEQVSLSDVLENGYSPETEHRTHVTIGDNNTAKDSHLFQSESIYPQVMRGDELLEGGYLVSVSASDLNAFSGPIFHRIGGEGGFAGFTELNSDSWPSDSPDELLVKARESLKIKLQLVTPALFNGGFLPKVFTGKDKSVYVHWDVVGVSLRLVSAAVPRWTPIAGWDMQTGQKPLRRLVPAGSIYFLEMENEADCEKILNKAWMKPISDNEMDRKNGFGLALWGIWS